MPIPLLIYISYERGIKLGGTPSYGGLCRSGLVSLANGSFSIVKLGRRAKSHHYYIADQADDALDTRLELIKKIIMPLLQFLSCEKVRTSDPNKQYRMKTEMCFFGALIERGGR
jgi:hypothetical protein